METAYAAMRSQNGGGNRVEWAALSIKRWICIKIRVIMGVAILVIEVMVNLRCYTSGIQICLDQAASS
jgi:hypothetical protein